VPKAIEMTVYSGRTNKIASQSVAGNVNEGQNQRG
jgi:hypothetical protein